MCHILACHIRDSCVAITKMLGSSAFPIIGRLRRRVINSAIKSIYCQGGRPPKSRQIAQYHSPEACPSKVMSDVTRGQFINRVELI